MGGTSLGSLVKQRSSQGAQHTPSMMSLIQKQSFASQHSEVKIELDPEVPTRAARIQPREQLAQQQQTSQQQHSTSFNLMNLLGTAQQTTEEDRPLDQSPSNARSMITGVFSNLLGRAQSRPPPTTSHRVGAPLLADSHSATSELTHDTQANSNLRGSLHQSHMVASHQYGPPNSSTSRNAKPSLSSLTKSGLRPQASNQGGLNRDKAGLQSKKMMSQLETALGKNYSSTQARGQQGIRLNKYGGANPGVASPQIVHKSMGSQGLIPTRPNRRLETNRSGATRQSPI